MFNSMQELRYAVRQLYKSPAFSLTALLTLAIGIGANLVVFGVLNSLVLDPLAVPSAESVFTVEHGGHDINSSFPDYLDLRDRNTTFAGLAAFRVARVGLETSAAAQPVWGFEVTGNYFEILGVRPHLGRLISASEEHGSSANEVAVLSYATWKSRFGADPAIVGKRIEINKHPYTVAGVAPASFHGTEKFFFPEVWLPILNEEQIEGYNWIQRRNNQNAWVVGRLKPGIVPAQATADLNRIAAQLAHDYPSSDEHLHFELSKPGFLGDMLGGPLRGFMFGVMLLAGLVLVAACTNLGGLLAARTSDRARELAIRVALGSSRAGVLRQLLIESVVLATSGGFLALAFSSLLLEVLSRWRPIADFPVAFIVRPDAKLYVLALLLSVVTGLLLGSIPIRQIWSTDPNHVLRGSSSTVPGSSRFALRDLLLGTQIAVCCLLITASFVSLRGLQRELKTPLGFDPHGATIANFDLHLAGYKKEEIPAMQQKLVETVAHLPGVTAAAYSNTTPLALDQSSTTIYDSATTDFRASTEKFHASYYDVAPGYFSTAGTRLLEGRDFTAHDDKNAPKVAIVNATFARKLFGSESAIGKSFIGNGRCQIIGVVEDGHYETLTEEPRAALFNPILQDPNSSTTLLVRSSLPPTEMVPAIGHAISQVDRSIPIFALSSWQDALSFVLFPAVAATTALSVFGAVAVVLALTGLFGLASYNVSKRLRELGIRLALGAQQIQVLRSALGRIAVLLAVGSAAGLLMGVAASKVLASIVYHATASDPVVLIAVILSMSIVGLLAAFIPAGRALGINPVELLRQE